MRIIDLQGDEYADDDQDDLAQGVAGIPLQISLLHKPPPNLAKEPDHRTS